MCGFSSSGSFGMSKVPTCVDKMCTPFIIVTNIPLYFAFVCLTGIAVYMYF